MKKTAIMIAILCVAALLITGCTLDIPGFTAGHEHSLVRVEGKAASCSETGTVEYWSCSGCEKKFADEEAAQEITDEELVIEKLAHIPGEDDGDCTTAIKCANCDQIATPGAESHVAGEDDGDCTTGIKCANCDQIATPGTESHVAGEDDGDCTTGIKCANCDQIVTPGAENHVAGEDDGDCTTGIKCANCDQIVTPGAENHVAGEDDGDCTTAIKCVNCDKNAVEAKDHVAGEDDGDVTTPVECVNCEKNAVEGKEAIDLTIGTFENGTVVADKKNYAVGDTVTLTITPADGYVQKLYINGEALLLDWKTNTYSFTAEEGKSYAITGSFEKSLALKPSDANRFDGANQAHGMLTTYYPGNNDSWWMDIEGNYDSITVNAKNYWAAADTYEGAANGGGFRIALRVTMDNGKNYAFSIWIDTEGRHVYNHFGGGGSATGWGGAWQNVDEKNPAAVAALYADGAQFKLERISGNKLRISINGMILETYTIEGVTEANKVVSMGVCHWGNKGEHVALPFTVANNMFNINGGNWDLSNQYNGSITILNKTGDGAVVETKENTCTEAAVTVKDLTPSKNEDGSLKQGNFSMQMAFIFADGKQYQVRIHNTDGDGNYKLQNMGGTNSLTGWKWQADLTADQKAKLLDGDGVEFRVKITDAGAELYVDGSLMKTVDLGEYNGQTARIQLCLNGSKSGTDIEIPFEVK